tara:strand:+ start:168 stop:1172 length:1005 start_codon:yes stop_codon:yes gene_type:complete
MKTGLVITTINNFNKNLRNIDKLCFKNKWDFNVIGDAITPKNFKLNYGLYYNIGKQKKLNFKFSKICPVNNYARKNLGYLILAKNDNEIIVETDDDNYPKKEFFLKRILIHNTIEIKNKSWINIYKVFLKNKKNFIWPRGLPLDEILRSKPKLSKKKKSQKFLLQQGVCDSNPDVDAIYRMYNKKLNIKFLDIKINLSNSLSTFNSQNTSWHISLLPLMYLPVTCSMRCTDIWRSLIALRIMKINNFNILFHGPTVYQKRNKHNLENDFLQEVPMYVNNKKIYQILEQIPLKKGKHNFFKNLIKCYKILVKNNFFHKKELKYLQAWNHDCKSLL